MKYYDWNNKKNETLKEERGVSFEQMVFHIAKWDILDMLDHPKQEK